LSRPGYDIIREGEDVVLHFNSENWAFDPSIEDNPRCMALVIEKLEEVRNATKIIFSQRRDYEYDYHQTAMLMQIARLHGKFVGERELLSHTSLGIPAQQLNRDIYDKFVQMQQMLTVKLREDPILCLVKLRRLRRSVHISLQQSADTRLVTAFTKFQQMLDYVIGLIEETKLAQLARPYLAGYNEGHRDIYRNIFSPIIKPDFMYAKLMTKYPADAEEIANYTLPSGTQVTVFRLADSVQLLYHIIPPEFQLSDDRYELLDRARNILAEHKPTKEEFVDPSRMREVFYNVSYDLIDELARQMNIALRRAEHDQLTKILLRYTVGFGLMEVLLEDEEMQDISINSPQGSTPVYIVHGKYDDCVTNIFPTKTEVESWATKLRLISGHSLDEADPLLDTSIELPGASVRVSAITQPLDPSGLAFSFRRHRDRPWTLPLFMKYRMINQMGAGLISFLVDGTRTMLIAGTRSSGKSSFLTSILVEIMRRYRIITVEDTLELPTNNLRKLGYNIQPLKVNSSLSAKATGMDAADGIRSTLRLGDSALIVGEVRSGEAKALYEAMRVGAAANVVAGTIHGDTPYGIYDRVVNDIGVPNTSFKATDIIIIANPIRSADGLHKYRRILEITEVRKDWKEDPQAEHGFVQLMKYNTHTDELEPTDALINGDSEILKAIAGNIKGLAGNWDAVWKNILVRGKMKQRVLDASIQENDPDMLEAEFVILCNDAFHVIYERSGDMDYDKMYREWEAWLVKAIRKRKKLNDDKPATVEWSA